MPFSRPIDDQIVRVPMKNVGTEKLPKGTRLALDSDLLQYTDTYDRVILTRRGFFCAATEDIPPGHFGLVELEW